MKRSASPLRVHALAIAVTLAAIALTRVFWRFFGSTPFAPVFGAVAAATHWGSGSAGLVSIAVASIGAALTFPTGVGPHPWNPRTLVAFVIIGLIGNRAIAGRNRAVAALRESERQLRATLDELRASEATLRQAQKMEAVGQLAAGVAHNFNNLLTITMGYTDVLLDDGVEAPARQSAVGEIRRATERGAALARQLLAFGRGHQPRVIRVTPDATLAALREMLRRAIREDIDLRIDTAAGSATVLIDPHDLEQAIVNLAINARDALRDGGRIEIDTAVESIAAGDRRLPAASAAGDYVRLRVRDNGVGMSPAVQSRLFEPFFTTKAVGEGTGLGLAFVHGVARHAGGFVTVDSAPGAGTTVCVFLPSVTAIEPAAVTAAPAAPQPAVTGATVLLVEDEDAVREVTVRMLTRAGCRVLPAGTPAEARTLFDRHGGEIAAMVTDVVMPEMSGPELAEALRARRPDLPVLFVSGYSDAPPVGATDDPRVGFLAKPFSAASLRTAVSAVMTAQVRTESR